MSVDDLLDNERSAAKIEQIFNEFEEYKHCYLCGNIYNRKNYVVYNIPVSRDVGYSRPPVRLKMRYNIEETVCESCQRQYGLTLNDVLKVVKSKK